MTAALALPARPGPVQPVCAQDVDRQVALALQLLDRGHAASFVATALGVTVLFVTQVETGAAIVRRERRS